MKSRDLSWQRKLLSAIIAILCFPKFIFKREVHSVIRKILIVEWNYLGDIVAASPTIRAVKENYPDAEVFLLTNPENKEYADSFRFIDGIIYIKNPLQLGRRKFSFKAIFSAISQLRSKQYDLVLELSGRLTSQFFLFFVKSRFIVGQDPTQDFYLLDKGVDSGRKHQIERNFDVVRLLDLQIHSKQLWDPSGQAEEIFIQGLLTSKKVQRKYIVIHPLASWQPREWPPENWASVAESLINQGLTVIFIGTQSEFERIEKIRVGLSQEHCFNFAGSINIIQLIALMKKAVFFMGTDSGPMHIAAIARLASLILFGPGDPEKWSYPQHRIIYKKPDCGPCAQLAYKTVCGQGLKTCKGLVEITAKEVIEECNILLSRKGDK